MQESQAVKDAYVRFCEHLSANDLGSFDDIVSAHPAMLVIGTAPGEWVDDRAQLRRGFESEGIALEAGDPSGYESGPLGWVVDEPNFTFPDGSTIRARVTFVFIREADIWKAVHAHFSVGVPDNEVVSLQERWSTAGAG